MKQTSKKGFTLIEIMIVIAIIALLAAVGIPAVTKSYAKAQEKTKKRNIAEVEKIKVMMTLPSEIGGMDYTNGEIVIVSNLCTIMELDGIDKLDVGNERINPKSIGEKAEYAPR